MAFALVLSITNVCVQGGAFSAAAMSGLKGRTSTSYRSDPPDLPDRLGAPERAGSTDSTRVRGR